MFVGSTPLQREGSNLRLFLYLFDRSILKLVKHISDGYALGALLLALVTGKAVPEHIGTKGQIFNPQATRVHDLMGQEPQLLLGVVKVGHHRTYRGAGLAAETTRKSACLVREAKPTFELSICGR